MIPIIGVRHSPVDDGTTERVGTFSNGVFSFGGVESGMMTFAYDDNGDTGKIFLHLFRRDKSVKANLAQAREFFLNDSALLAFGNAVSKDG